MSLNETNIGWTDYTLNVIRACAKISEGCANCWAARLSTRQGWTDKPWTIDNLDENFQVFRERLDHLDRLPGPRYVWVVSMSDLFNPAVPEGLLDDVLDRMAEFPDSAFQILTKWGPETDAVVPELPPNVMLGVTVESPRRTPRIEWLCNQDATVRFISFEPLVEGIRPDDVDLTGVDWAIVGGETAGKDRRRDMDPEWARWLLRACRRDDAAYFFKQHSALRPEQDIRLAPTRDSERTIIREFPREKLREVGVVEAPQEYL